MLDHPLGDDLSSTQVRPVFLMEGGVVLVRHVVVETHDVEGGIPVEVVDRPLDGIRVHDLAVSIHRRERAVTFLHVVDEEHARTWGRRHGTTCRYVRTDPSVRCNCTSSSEGAGGRFVVG